MRVSTIVFAVAMIASNDCAVAFNSGVNQLVNNRFNKPVVSEVQTFVAPSSEIPGWTVVAGSIDLIPASHWNTGEQLIDLVGDELGVIEQQLELKSEVPHRLRLQFANHLDVTRPVSALVEVISGSEIYSEKIQFSGWNGQQNNAGNLILDFVTGSSETTIRFTALDQEDGNGIVLLRAFAYHFLLGDMNCDNAFNLQDVDPWVNCLTNCAYSEAADINMDGTLNLLDVEPFIELMLGN